MMRVQEFSPMKDGVSWTANEIKYFLHIIDRTKVIINYLFTLKLMYRLNRLIIAGTNTVGCTLISFQVEDFFKEQKEKIADLKQTPNLLNGFNKHLLSKVLVSF